MADFCREILLNGEVVAVPQMTDNEREAIAILHRIAMFYGQIPNLIKVKSESWVKIAKSLSMIEARVHKPLFVSRAFV